MQRCLNHFQQLGWHSDPQSMNTRHVFAQNVLKFLNYMLQCKINSVLCLWFSQSNTLKSRNGSEWRAYCNLNDLGQFFPVSYYVTHRMSWIWILQNRQFKGTDARVVRTHSSLALTSCEWRWTRGLLLDITFALILIRYAAKAVVWRWIGVTTSSLVLFHFPWWHIFLWRLTLGQTLHS